MGVHVCCKVAIREPLGRVRVDSCPSSSVPFPAPLFIGGIVLDEDDSFIYVGGSNVNSSTFWFTTVGKVWQISKSNLAVVGSTVMPAGTILMQWVCNDATYVYALVWRSGLTHTGVVVRILKATMAVVDFIDMPANFVPLRMWIADGVALYIAGTNSEALPTAGVITVINLPGFTLGATSTIAIPAGYQCYSGAPCNMTAPPPSTIHPIVVSDGTTIYGFVAGSGPPMLFEVDQASLVCTRLTIGNAAGLAGAANREWCEIAMDATYVYLQTPSRLIRFLRSDLFTFDIANPGQTMSGVGGNLSTFAGISMARQSDAGAIYFTSTQSPAKLYSLSKANWLTVTLLATATAGLNVGRFLLRDNTNPARWFGLTNMTATTSRGLMRYI